MRAPNRAAAEIHLIRPRSSDASYRPEIQLGSEHCRNQAHRCCSITVTNKLCLLWQIMSTLVRINFAGEKQRGENDVLIRILQ